MRLAILPYGRGGLQDDAAPVSFAFLPLTLYLWDIPFSGRVICRSLHDAQPVLGGFHMRTAYLYAWGAAAYVATLVYLLSAARDRVWRLPSRIEPLSRPAPAVELPSLSG
jgi:hypothetical protein